MVVSSHGAWHWSTRGCVHVSIRICMYASNYTLASTCTFICSASNGLAPFGFVRGGGVKGTGGTGRSLIRPASLHGLFWCFCNERLLGRVNSETRRSPFDVKWCERRRGWKRRGGASLRKEWMLRGPRGAAKMRRNRSWVEWLLVISCHTCTGRCEEMELGVCAWCGFGVSVSVLALASDQKCLKSYGYIINRDWMLWYLVMILLSGAMNKRHTSVM